MEASPTVALPSTPQAPALARRHLQRVGRDWPDDVLEMVLLLASEVVTNAVRYGSDPILLTVRAIGPRVRVEVADANPAPPTPRPSSPDGWREGGRGLHILDVFATEWGSSARTDPPGKTVWFELDRGSVTPSGSEAGRGTVTDAR